MWRLLERIGLILALVLGLGAIMKFVSQDALVKTFLGLGGICSIGDAYLLYRIFWFEPRQRWCILCFGSVAWVVGICLIKVPQLLTAISWSERGVALGLFVVFFGILVVILALYFLLERKYFKPDMVKDRFIRDSVEIGNTVRKGRMRKIAHNIRKYMDTHYIERSHKLNTAARNE